MIAGPFTLDPSYQHLFLADNHTSPEIIFPVTQDGKLTQTYGGMTFLIHASCGGSMAPGDQGMNGCWGGLRLKPRGVQPFRRGRPAGVVLLDRRPDRGRRQHQHFHQRRGGSKSLRTRQVTGTNGSDLEFPDTDFPMFRLGDAYLMYAEAHLRGGGGDRAQALAYVNALRQRAFGDASGNITDGDLDARLHP